MFRRFTRFVPKTSSEIAVTTLGGGTLIGSGIGFYRGYEKSRSLPYSDSLIETIGGVICGGYTGFIVAITLPITLPVTVCTSVLRFSDEIIYGNLLCKKIHLNIEDIFD